MLAIWSLLLLPLQNSACTSGHSWLMNCWSLDFEHYLASMWNKHNCMAVWPFFGLALLWTGMKIDHFQSCGYSWVFHISWHLEYSTLIASSFKIWNSSAVIPSPLLALFVVVLPKPHLTSHFKMSNSRWVTTPSRLSRLFIQPLGWDIIYIIYKSLLKPQNSIDKFTDMCNHHHSQF